METNKVIQGVYITTLRRIGAVATLVVLLFQASNGQFQWEMCPQNPVLPGESLLGWDSHHVVQPSVVLNNGIYYMWYRGWAEYWLGTLQSIGLAISLNGTEWYRYAKNPVLKGDLGDWTKGEVENPSVAWINDTYFMFFTNGETSKHIGLATSINGMDWEPYPEPVISIGSEGDWDSERVHKCCRILEWNEQYWTWYGGKGDAGWSIGVATSSDLKKWKKLESNPVFFCGDEGEWDSDAVLTPFVFLVGDGLEMWYSGRSDSVNALGRAFSQDGIHWKKASNNPIFGPGNPDDWDGSCACDAALVFTPDSIKLWYSGHIQYDWNIGHAISPIPEDMNLVNIRDDDVEYKAK